MYCLVVDFGFQVVEGKSINLKKYQQSFNELIQDRHFPGLGMAGFLVGLVGNTITIHPGCVS
jgi:hypothetical protein